MRKVHHLSSIQQFIIRVSICTTATIRFSVRGASLHLVVEERALIRNRVLIGDTVLISFLRISRM